MATEQHRVVIDVDYVGERDVERYLAAMRRIGAITQEQQRLAGQLNSSQGPAALASVFGTQAAVAGEYESRAQAAIASTKALQRETDTLRRSVEALQRSFQTSPTGGFGQLRQQLTDVLVANQVMRQIQDAGARFTSQQAFLPGGIPAGTPQYQLSRLSGAYVAPSPALQAIGRAQERAERVLRAAEQPQLDLSRAQTEAAAQTRRTTAAQRRLEQQTNQAIAALPVGSGQPRRGDYGLTPPGAFMSRAAATSIDQARYLEGLRERITAERSLVTQISRTEGFFTRLAALETRGAILDIGPGGAPSARFESAGEAPAVLQDLTVRLRALSREVDSAYESFSVTNQARNRRAYEINSAALAGMANQYSGSTLAGGQLIGKGEDQSYIVASELHQLAARVAADTSEQILFYQGAANSRLLRGLAPETREVLIGTPEHPHKLGINNRADTAWPVQGLMNRDQVFQTMREEAVGGLLDRQAELTRELRAAHAAFAGTHGLPLGATMANQPQNQAVIREATAAVQGFTAAVRQAQQRIEAQDAAYAYGPRQFHGTLNALPPRLAPIDQIRMANAQAYGPALYTTPDPLYAAAHAMGINGNIDARLGPIGRVEAGVNAPPGHLYEVTAPVGKVLNLLSVITKEEMASLETWLQRSGAPGIANKLRERFDLNNRTIEGAPGVPGLGLPPTPGGTLPGLQWRDVYGFLPESGREMFNQRLASQGYAATTIPGEQTMWLRPEALRTQLVGRVTRENAMDPLGNPMMPRGIMPHPTLYGSTEQWPELQRALAARTAAEQRAAAAANAAAAAGGGRGALPPGVGGGGYGGRGGGMPPPPPGSPSGGNWWDPLDRDFRQIGAGQYSRVLAAQAQVAKAEADLANVRRKGELPFGSEGAFKNDAARVNAYAGAVSRAQRAHEGLNRAMGQTAAPVNLGVQQGPTMPLLGGTQQTVDGILRQRGAITTTPLESAQQNLTEAQRNLASATKAHQQVINGQYRSQQQAGEAYATSLGNLTRAQSAHANAQNRMVNTTRTLAAGAGGGGSYGGGGGFGPFGGDGFMGAPRGGGGGVFSNFYSGFRGNQDRSYAEMLGQTARFSVMYGAMYNALFMLTQTLQATLMEGIQFEQAMTELSIAAQRPKEELESLANSVSDSAIAAGLAPSQGVELAARSLGLYGVTDGTLDQQTDVARISTRVASRLALGAKKDPLAVQTDLAAIVQSLGLDPTAQQRVADLDAYMTKHFGVTQGSTLETVAQSGSVGKAAGFSDEQLFGIAALMQARTGQTPSAVAGFMAQIFSRGGEGSLVDVASRQGIDPEQPLSQIIAQLAGLYGQADPREQAEISAAFGRGKIQNAAVALLQDFEELQSRAGQAQTESLGFADNTFNERINNLGGELAVLMGLFKEFASELGQAGLLDIIGVGVLVLQEFLKAVNGVLEIWNSFGDTTQRVVIGMGLLLAAIKSETVHRAFANNALRAQGAAGILAPGAIGPMPQVTRGAMATAAAGTALGALIHPATLAIGGLLAIGAVKNSMDRLREAEDAAVAAIRAPGELQTAADFRNQAALLQTTAQQQRDATGGFHNFISFGTANDDPLAMAEVFEAEAKRLQEVAARLEVQESSVTPADAIFASLAAEDIQDGLDGITKSGGTARDQMAALADALLGAANNAGLAADAFSVEDFGEREAPEVQKAILEGLADFRIKQAAGANLGELASDPRNIWETAQQERVGLSFAGKDYSAAFAREFSGEKMTERIQGGLRTLGVESLGDIDLATAAEVAEFVGAGVADTILEGSGANKKTIAEFQEHINLSIRDYLFSQSRAAVELRDPNSELSATDATALAQNLVATSGDIVGGLQDSDHKTRQSEIQNLIRQLRKTQSRTDEPIAYITEQMDIARRALAQSQFEEFEALRRVAMQNAKNKKEASEVGREMLVAEINKAVKGGNVDLLIEIIGQAGRGSIAIVRAAIEDARTVAQAALQQARAVIQAAAGFGVLAGGYAQDQISTLESLGLPVPQNLQDIAAAGKAAGKAQKTLDELEGTELGVNTGGVYAGPDGNKYNASGMDVYNPNIKDAEEKLEKDKETAAERAAAQAEAMAVRSQGSMDAARASILSAQAAIAKADKNSVEYWNAMGQLFGAQNALADALRQYQVNLRLLEIDLTNPLQEARAATAAAAKKLADDLSSGKADDVVAQSQVDLKRAQAAEEATKFQQRLSTVQTAEELGRISHSRYINYLENEKNRLESIKNRTFQQQDQLNQIDRLLQGAAKELQGQFNLGDINLPTPYQVRRYIEQTSGAKSARQAAQMAMVTTNNVDITINGDPESIRREITKYVGRAGRTLTAAPRRGR